MSQKNSLRPASFAKRLAAWLIDMGIISLFLWLASLTIAPQTIQNILAPVAQITQTTPTMYEETPSLFKVFLLINLLQIVGNYIYSTYLTAAWGQTIGKRILRIQVVTIGSHKPPRLPQALLRETIGKFMSGIFVGAGFLWYFQNKKHQCWHDLLGGTVVVNKKN